MFTGVVVSGASKTLLATPGELFTRDSAAFRSVDGFPRVTGTALNHNICLGVLFLGGTDRIVLPSCTTSHGNNYFRGGST